ncbi:hypothetical protein ABT294_50280 [Nonomuraea sp. NPDC000554]|uniref:hypothetical protein n=1 Tax=Nonomuraea sp. NPDC000554 TaxID=3154259 RepID=UPI003333B029
MRLSKLLADWYWRVNAFMGGDVEPHRGQRFSATHPVRLGFIMFLVSCGLFGVSILVKAAADARSALTLNVLIVWLVGAAAMGLLFTGVGYLERQRQKHHGHYPHEDRDQSGDRP